MHARRIVWFIVAIVVGLGAGLLVGWGLSQSRYANVSPDTLRADYKADLVLMVAEIYQQEGDPAAAVDRLAAIEAGSPIRQVQLAILTGQELGYPRSDMETLARLFQALQTWIPSPETEQP